MSKKNNLSPDNFISSLRMNRLSGRMMRIPSSNKKKNREILMIYGHHASLERMFGFAEDLCRYGNITIPDLPGLGGMQSFYKIDKKPTIDNYADYLASFIKLKFKRRRITIIGVSFGFAVVTRMLQKYPDLAKKVDLLISVVGFTNKNDFKFNRSIHIPLRIMTFVFRWRITSWLIRHLILRKTILKIAYNLVATKHSKLKDGDKEAIKERINFEIKLWQINDFRTHIATLREMLNLNLCNEFVKMSVYHVAVSNDRYLDEHNVEQHMRIIYEEFHKIKAEVPSHAPSIVANKKEAAIFVPNKIRTLLNTKPSK